MDHFVDPVSLVPPEFFESPEYVQFLVELIDSGDAADKELADRLVLNFPLPARACAEDSGKIQNALGKAIRICSPLSK
jgi:hypothetical protein